MGFMGGPPSAIPAAPGIPGIPPPPTAAPEPTPTRQIRLENLLDEATLADDAEYVEVVADIREECAKHGALTDFCIPRKGELLGKLESDAGKCFVTYAEVSAALAAYRSMHGRDFDGNKVRVTFLPDA